MTLIHPWGRVLLLIVLLPAAAVAATAPYWESIPQHGDVPPPIYEAGISARR